MSKGIPKHLMESKLITDEQWDEYNDLKQEKIKLEKENNELRIKVNLLNKMNETNYNKYCELLKERK